MPFQTTGNSVTVPAPIGGLNTRDATDLMQETDAIRLDNFFPARSFVQLRKGHSNHVTGIGAAVESLLPYNSGTTSKLFAASGAFIYDVTSAGSVGSAEVSSLSNAKWQSANITTSGGSFLFICNGADAPRHYNGLAWATPSITGITPANVVNVTVHKERLFFIQNDSLTFAYLGTKAVAGSASTFDLGSVFSKGGKLMAMGSWSRDGGSGMDDAAVFFTSEGQLAIYQGTNPASADTWSLIGVFDAPRPIGRRCILQQGSECYLITEGGIFPMTQILGTGEAAPNKAITDKISGSYIDAVEAFATRTSGWEGIVYPKGGYGLFNVPLSTVNTYQQFVVNLDTGAWARFTGQNAYCWALLAGKLYFGAATTVCLADDGFADVSTTIEGNAKTAFIYFGGRDGPKRYTALRPVMASNASLNVSIGFDVDYEDGISSVSSSTGDAGSASSWDLSSWDTTNWGGAISTTQDWQSVANIGWNAAIRLRTATTAQSVRWLATDVRFEKGSGL